MTGDDTAANIRQAAHQWRAALAEGPLPPDRRQAFDRWLAADPRHRAAYEQAQRLWAELGDIERADYDPAFLKPAEAERTAIIGHRARRATAETFRRPVARFGAAAAVLMVSIVAVLIMIAPSDGPVATEVTYVTRTAEIRDVPLDDGSVVTLGADSRLTVTLDARARHLTLRSGEAFFLVAPDPRRPFTVAAGATAARAVGTAFDVRRAAGSVHVAVVEGVVDVSHAPPQPAASDATAVQTRVRLGAGQQVAAASGRGLGAATAIEPEAVGAWRSGRLVYVAAPLSELVADANRYHDHPIRIADEATARLTVTGSFYSDDIDGMLATLAEALPIDVHRSAAGRIAIRAWR